MDAITRLIARSALARNKASRETYAADVAAWYRSGEGRPHRWVDTEHGPVNYGGSGYGYPSCPHGMSLWTDFDNICGACEDGYTVYQLALSEAYDAAREFNKRDGVMTVLKEQRHQFTDDAWKELIEWYMEPLNPYLRELNERAADRLTHTTRWAYACQRATQPEEN